MSNKDCPGFKGCEAPICPMDNSFNTAVWYPDEPICPLRKYRTQHWRIIQRKIAKKNLTHRVEGCFTLAALENIQNVRGGIKGLDSDARIFPTRKIMPILHKKAYPDTLLKTVN